ncbi:hypothetical protein BpHYR1_035828 [Brachionus plicatilis]|uniref:RING-type domain-containing protein n=1 Tax=Brachionus plicatilis TaxID=10195 RepID=A0A3M7PHS3_BRAPC|nr:hypothetical protein BpHYR1_035828 [Brachionus plicatilis]
MSDDKDKLESELDKLRVKNEQLSQTYREVEAQLSIKDQQLCAQKKELQSATQRVERLEEENEELRGRQEQEEPLKCPVCLEFYTSERRAVALFCSHMLCRLWHQRLTELDSSSLCPMCRGMEVTNCLNLF